MSKAITFWLSESDQDLIDWLNGLSKGQRSQSIRSTLRAGIEGQKQGQINDKLDRILDRLCGIALEFNGPCPDDEIEMELPDALLATLGGLGK